MKRFISMFLALAMVFSVPMVTVMSTAADDTLVDQLSVVGSYADSTEALKQPDVGIAPSLEIYPSPENVSVTNISKFSFLMINLKGYSGQSRADGRDMPLDDNFFYSLRQTLESARDSQSMVGIRFRFDDLGHEKKEPDWNNMIQMFLDIEANGVLEDYADIITWCEIGTLGAFGEQWGTRYGDWGYSDELIDLYLRILPEQIDLLHRSPSKIWHWVNFKLGTSYSANNVQNMVSQVNNAYGHVVNNKAGYVSGDGKNFSSGNLVKDDLKRLGIFNDGYMGTNWDYGTYSNRANETAFMNDQVNVPYGGEFSGDRYLQLYYGSYNTVWYPENAIPEMYYTNLAYLHSGVWYETAVDANGNPICQDFSTLNAANNFKTQYSFIVDTLGRSELKDAFTITQTTNSSGTTVYRATYTALGYDTLPFTAEVEAAVEAKNGVTLDLSEYHGLSSKKFIEDHIGYRFILRDSDMSGTLLPGDTFEYDFDIENTGFFKIDKEKEVELVFVNGGQQRAVSIEGVDVRTWDTGIHNLSGSVAIPENMPGGEWSVYLRISPVNAESKDDASYGVKFANANIFNEAYGANLVGKFTVDGPVEEIEAFVDSRPAGEYYTDGETATYAADIDYLNFMDGSYTFTEDGHYGFTILFKLDGIKSGSEINLTRWETNGSEWQLHAFNYFFKNNATYGYGKTLTANGYYMIYVPFFSVSASQSASVAGETTYTKFYCNAAKTGREDKDTPTSLNGNPATITPLGIVEGGITSYSITLHMPDNTTRKLSGTYNVKNTDKAVAENVQFVQAMSVYSGISAYNLAGYTDENGISYKFVGWTTQKGFKEGLIHEDQIALGDMHLYPYYEPDLEANAARLNGLVKDTVGGVDADGIVYTIDTATRTAKVGTGSVWAGNAGFRGGDAVLPAYINVNGTIYTVNGIGANAFAGCVALDKVYIPQTYTDIADSVFMGVESDITLYATDITADGMTYGDVIGYAEDKGINCETISANGEYVVVFTEEDGTILQVGVQAAGESLSYDGTIANKEADDTYCYYAFNGWSKAAPYTADTCVSASYIGVDHQPGDKVYSGEGSCGEEVPYVIYCTECKDQLSYGSEVLINHEYGEYTSDGNATCTEDGTKSATCGNCGGKDTVADEGSALGHDYEYVTTPAKPGVAGVITGTCGGCGDVTTEEIPALPAACPGDSNGDGTLNVIDITLSARYIAQNGFTGSFDLSGCIFEAMDINGDGVIDQFDLNALAAAIRAQ